MLARKTFELFTLFALGLVAAMPTMAIEPIADQPLLKLTTTAPKAGRGTGLLQDSQYRLTFRLRSNTAPAYVEIKERFGGSEDFEVLVLDDPDNCLDLSQADPIFNLPLTAGCPGGADETFLLFRQDPFEAPGYVDSASAGGTGGCVAPYFETLRDTLTENLVSQGGIVPFNEATKSYYVDDSGALRAVGPLTDSDSVVNNDCYGYSADDDIRGLVVMADIGGAQIFDTDLTYDTSRIRNMAGLLTHVGYELLDKKDRTAIFADMAVTENMLEPVVFVDLGPNTIGFAPLGGYTNPEFSYRIANGPVETVALEGMFTDAQLLAEVRAVTTTAFQVVVRSVVVEGVAPDFIDDVDGNGIFNKKDLTLAGYTLLSNQSTIKRNIIPRELLREEEDSYECPSNLLYTDLNGDGVASSCEDGDGTSRSILRVPR